MSKQSCKTCGKAFEGDARRRYCVKHAPPKRIRTKARPQFLRAIEPGEHPEPPKKFVTIAEAAAAGSTIDELRLTRMRIARTLDDPNCPARDLASLSKRLMELGREIEVMVARQREESEGGTGVADEAFDAEAI